MKPTLKLTLLKRKSTDSPANAGGSCAPTPPKKKRGKRTTCLLPSTLRNNAFNTLHNQPTIPEFRQPNVPYCTLLKLKGQLWAGSQAGQGKAKTNRCGNKNPDEVIVDLEGIPTAADLMVPGMGSKDTVLKLDEGYGPKIGRFNVHYLVVVSNEPGDLGVMYALTGNQNFTEVYADYADKVDCRVKDMVLTNSRTGTVVSPHAIACYVGLKHGDMLYANHKNPEANMNAWIKKFYITTVSDNPRKVKVEGRLDTKLSNIYHMWGEAFNFDPKKVMLMNQCRVLSPSQTIGAAKIRNKGIVYAQPNIRYHRCARESDSE